MKPSPLVDVVAHQYERWTYPQPIDDVDAWLQSRHEYFDPSLNHRILWPDRD